MSIRNRFRLIVLSLVFLPFMIPEYLLLNQTIKTFVSVFRVVSLLVIVIKLYMRNTKITWRFIAIILAIIELFFSTILSDTGNILIFINYIIIFFVPALLLDLYLRDEYSNTVKVISVILAIEIVINAFSQFLIPDGLYLRWGVRIAFFLGIENRFVFTYIAFLAFGLALVNVDKKYRWFYRIILIIINISLIKAWSVGAMIAVFIFDLLYILSLKGIKIMSITRASIIWTGSFIAIVVFRVQDLFVSFLQSTFNKDTTFSGRTALWDASYGYIKKRLLFGYGIQNDEKLIDDFKGVSHPHNQVLYLMYMCGIIGLIVFIIFGIMCLKKVAKYNGKTELYNNYVAIYFSLMIMLLVDSWTSTSYLFMIFILFSNIDKSNLVDNYCDEKSTV